LVSSILVRGADGRRQKRYRSYEWFGKPDRDSMVHRSWMKNQGLPHHLFDGRPVIGICNTYSEVTPCNAHFREIAERVKRGVLEAGGFPLEFRVMSLGELEKRRREWKAPPAHDVRGYVRLYCDHVNQADKGVDMEWISWWAAAVPLSRGSLTDGSLFRLVVRSGRREML